MGKHMRKAFIRYSFYFSAYKLFVHCSILLLRRQFSGRRLNSDALRKKKFQSQKLNKFRFNSMRTNAHSKILEPERAVNRKSFAEETEK